MQTEPHSERGPDSTKNFQTVRQCVGTDSSKESRLILWKIDHYLSTFKWVCLVALLTAEFETPPNGIRLSQKVYQ